MHLRIKNVYKILLILLTMIYYTSAKINITNIVDKNQSMLFKIEENKMTKLNSNSEYQPKNDLKADISNLPSKSNQMVMKKRIQDETRNKTASEQSNKTSKRDVNRKIVRSTYRARPHGNNYPYNVTFPGNRRYGGDARILNQNWTVGSNGKKLCTPCLCKDEKVICLHTHSEENEWHELTIAQNDIPNEAETIHIRGYDSVHIKSNALNGRIANIRTLSLEDIRNLTFDKFSFFIPLKNSQKSSLEINIRNCIIPNMPSRVIIQEDRTNQGHKILKKYYTTIRINKCHIESIQTEALIGLKLQKFEMINSEVEKMGMNSLNVDVSEVTNLQSNNFPYLPKEAIKIRTKMLIIVKNTMVALLNRSINVEAEGQVLIERNNIGVLGSGALKMIGFSEETFDYGRSLTFSNNLMQEAEEGSLGLVQRLSPHEPILLNNSFNVRCQCNISQTFKQIFGALEEDTVRFNLFYRSSRCLESESETYTSVESFLSNKCSPFPLVTVIAVSVAGLLLLVVILSCIFCSIRVKRIRERASMGDCLSHSFSTLSKNDSDRVRSPLNFGQAYGSPQMAVIPWGVDMQEVKTYQQNLTPEFTEEAESMCSTSKQSSNWGRLEFGSKSKNQRASCPFN